MTSTDQPPTSRFALDMRVSLGNLLSIITLLGAVGVFVLQYEARLVDLEASAANRGVVINNIASDMASMETQFRLQVAELSALIEQNKEWQVRQRIRVWDDLGTLKRQMNDVAGDLKVIAAVLSRVEARLDRVPGQRSDAASTAHTPQ